MEWNKTYQGDNLDTLKQLIDEGHKFHLILTDPPYAIGKDFGNNTDKIDLDTFLDEIDKRINLLSKLLTDNGSLIWFCTHLYVGDVQLVLRRYLNQRRMMIWHYENGMSRQIKEPVTEYEPFWWFSKSESFIYNGDDVRVPYKTDRVLNPVYKLDSHGNKRAWNPNPKGKRRGDVWKYPVLAGKIFEDERTEHPTQKPLSLWLQLIKAFSPKTSNGVYSGKVLDPYHGSGTTGHACEKINKENNGFIKWMGCELENKWAEIADKRIEKERKRQIEPDLFNND